MSSKDKSMPIKTWRSTDPKLIDQDFEPVYELVVKPFELLKQGWVIRFENSFWRIISIHTKNTLKIRKLTKSKNKVLKTVILNEATVRFLMINSQNIKKIESKPSVTMDFDKLYGKTWSISGGLPSLGKKR